MTTLKAKPSRVERYFGILPILYLLGCGIHQGGVPSEMNFATPPSGRQIQTTDYRIAPGDLLVIKFFYNPELNEELPVRPDGKLSLPLIGELQAAGLTSKTLESELSNHYQRQLRQPEITVIVKTFAKQQVFVDGEVEHPGQIDLLPGLNTWQAIIKAGGFKDTATRESVIVISHGDRDQPIPYRINLTSDALDRSSAFFQLKPYDVVFVPKTWIAEADKFTKQYVEELILFKGWYFNINPVPNGFGI